MQAQAHELINPSATFSRRHSVRIGLWAAVLLAVLCGGYWVIRQPGLAISTSRPRAATTAANEFYVISTQPAQQTIIAQAYNEFTIGAHGVGATIGSYHLERVEAAAIEVATMDQPARRVSVSDWNREVTVKLQDEVRYLEVVHARGHLSESQWERLYQIAASGEARALQWLQRMADSAAPHKDGAKDIIDQGLQAQLVRKTATLARTGARPHRISAIHALGRIADPLAVHALAELAGDLVEDELGLMCLEILGRRAAPWLSAELQAVVGRTGSTAVRDRAIEMLSQ